MLEEAKLEMGVHILGEMIVEVDLKGLIEETVGKRDQYEWSLTNLVVFQITMLGSVVPVLLGKMWWIQGAYHLMTEQVMFVDIGPRMSVC